MNRCEWMVVVGRCVGWVGVLDEWLWWVGQGGYE